MKPIPDREPEVRARLDGLLHLTRDGGLAPTDFAYVRNGFFPAVAKRYQEQLLKLGTVQQALLVQRKVLGDDRIYTYELRYATESLIVTLGLAPDDKVSLFTIRPKLPLVAGLQLRAADGRVMEAASPRWL